MDSGEKSCHRHIGWVSWRDESCRRCPVRLYWCSHFRQLLLLWLSCIKGQVLCRNFRQRYLLKCHRFIRGIHSRSIFEKILKQPQSQAESHQQPTTYYPQREINPVSVCWYYLFYSVCHCLHDDCWLAHPKHHQGKAKECEALDDCQWGQPACLLDESLRGRHNLLSSSFNHSHYRNICVWSRRKLAPALKTLYSSPKDGSCLWFSYLPTRHSYTFCLSFSRKTVLVQLWSGFFTCFLVASVL